MNYISSEFDNADYTTGVAHDLGNLLAVMAGRLDNLKSLFPHDHTALSQVAELEQILDQGRDLTASMLYSSNSSPNYQEPLELSELLSGCHDVLNAVSGNDVDMYIETHGICRILGNRRHLQRLLLNAADNARKAMPRGGRFTIVAQSTGTPDSEQTVQLVISDTGHGLSYPQRQMLLGSRNIVQRGIRSGMGLRLIRAIADEHDARIAVWSSPAMGTRLMISFPLCNTCAADHNSYETNIPPRLASTVLVVCQQQQLREFIGSALTDAGHAILETAEINSASDLLRRTAPSVSAVLLDADDFQEDQIIEMACKSVGQTPIVVLASRIPETLANSDTPLIILPKPTPLATIAKTLTWLTTSSRSEAA